MSTTALQVRDEKHPDERKFDTVARQAAALARSTVIPADYQGNPANCLVALEMAHRTGMPALAVMQNLHLIGGRPSWSSTFLIAAANASGRFSPLRYRFEGEEGTDSWGCRAVATDLATGDDLVGTLITMGIARDEGWAARKGSKWKTMPEQMLRYRAAAFWVRAYAPEIAVGLHTVDEVRDMPAPAASRIETLSAQLAASDEPADEAEAEAEDDIPDNVDPDTGEFFELVGEEDDHG